MGHIVRCTTIAKKLRECAPDAEIMFLTKEPEGKGYVQKEGFRALDVERNEISQITNLISGETILITDFLDTDGDYISRIRATEGIRVISIDNNTRFKKLAAHVVVNANVFDEGDTKTVGSTPYYLGPKYVVLREEIRRAHDEADPVRDKVVGVLVMSGGGDMVGGRLTLTSVEALKDMPTEVSINLVVGPTFPYKAELRHLLLTVARPFNVFLDPPNVVEIMRTADLAITAAGTALYELAAIGIPTIAVPQVAGGSTHQVDIANYFEKRGACLNAGRSASTEQLHTMASEVIKDKTLRKRLSDNGRMLVDGRGLERLLQIIFGLSSPR